MNICKKKAHNRKDLTGYKFHKLTVLRHEKTVDTGNNRSSYWLCKCECGNTRIVTSRNLKNNSIKTCGCSSILKNKYTKAEDYVGTTVNSWEIIELTNNKDPYGSSKIFIVKCPKCKKLSKSNITRCRRAKKCKSCKEKEKMFENGEHVPSLYMKSLFRGAQYRKLKFNITIEYLDKLIEEQCFKCAVSGRPIILENDYRKRADSDFASLDRIDSSIGYEPGNVQWVHKEVNGAKLTMNNETFIKLCIDVSNNQKEK